MAKRDYYEVLGVSKSASADEIKRAYRKQAMKHHPDKHGGDDTQIKEINEAYEILKDKSKRAEYDQFGHNGPFGAGAGAGGSQGFGGFDFNGQGFDFSSFGGGFGDIFDMFMGGQGGGRQRQAERRGADLQTSVTLDFKDAIFGAEETLHFNALDRCERCSGKGAEPGTKLKKCATCDGAGQVTKMQQTILGAIRQTAVCSNCAGEGEIPEEKCQMCRGAGVVKNAREVKIKIPAGIDDGATIRLGGKGGADKKGPNGDLYVNVRVKPHSRLRRNGHDIESIVAVPMVIAALGGETEVETVDGKVTLKIPAGTQSSKVFKLSERGVPGIGNRKRGDHMVTVVVEIPTKLSSKQKQLLEEFENEGGKKRFW